MRAKLARLLQSRAATNKADGLWRRYLLGLALMMSLILTANYANRTALELGQIDGDILQDVGDLQMLSQRILFLAKQMHFAGPDADNMAAFQVALARFEETRENVTGNPDLPVVLRTGLFQEPMQLDGRLQLFEATARGLQTSLATGVAVDAAMTPLTEMAKFDVPQLLDEFLRIFAAASNQSTSNMQDLQTLILGVAIFVLLLEAFFVYLPAHLIVKRTLANLRRRADDLSGKRMELSRVNRALNRAAKLDALTELPNRTYLIEILARALKNPNDKFHLLYLDIDRFRAINDASGEATGDLLLKHISITLQKNAQSNDLVARTGGDEFVIVTRSNPAKMAEAILRRFDRPITLAGRICQTGLCIGYTTRNAAQTDAMALLSDAELALNDAKTKGRSHISVYTQEMRAATADRDLLLSEISPALDDGQILPYYQPQISLGTGHISGIEVLARWVHPTRGMIPPDDFLPLATQEGLAREVDFVIWERAMSQLVRWRHAGMVVPQISLNASPDTIADPQLVGYLLDRLGAHGLGPGDLAIEVLETTFIGSIFDMAALNIDRLIAAGIAVELDDFGTGYTSLSTLIQLNLSAIKLDRSLVQPLPAPRAQSILRAVMALATEMKLHVVAEGIETDAQSEYLRDIGCDVGQGYGIGKPMTARDFAVWAADPQLWAPRPRNIAPRRA